MTTIDPFPCCQLCPNSRKILNMQVGKHLETNDIFLAKQHGLRQKHSTETALSELVGHLAETFDKSIKPLQSLLT